MANLLDIKRRIRSVKSTQKITKAMKMVAAAKLRRSQDRILATRPYALELAKVTGKLAQAARHPDAEPAADERLDEILDAEFDVDVDAPDEAGAGPDEIPVVPDSTPSRGKGHPLLQHREETRVLLVVVTGDRGLAGPFNSAVQRRALEALKHWDDVELLLLGKKGADFFGRRSTPIRAAYRELFTEVTYEQAQGIARDISEAYAAQEYDAVYVIYNQFRSIMQQELTEERLLPIPVDAEDEDAEIGVPGGDYIYEPSPEGILTEILPRYVEFQVYRVLLESQAAEHAARMTAMESATKNAGEMIDKLTLSYNRARQAAITTELIEVVSGANALEG